MERGESGPAAQFTLAGDIGGDLLAGAGHFITAFRGEGLAGFGGGLSSFSIGHIDPDMAFWTTSGEFVFIAVLGGTRNAYAPLLGAIVLELIRSLAYQYAPNTWQVVMGTSMLVLIVFLPGGLISLTHRALEKRRARQRAQEAGI